MKKVYYTEEELTIKIKDSLIKNANSLVEEIEKESIKSNDICYV